MSDVSTNYNLYSSSSSNAVSSNDYYQSSSSSSLDINDFMNLLVAQLTNQDVLDPSSDTEFISQMAQFTALQTTQTMTEIIYAQYGSSMVGKTVKIAAYDDLGNYTETEGTVDSVVFYNGDCQVVVNGGTYSMSSIMEVVSGSGDTAASHTDSST